MDDHARIYEEWHRYAKNRDTEGLLSLYAEDAVFESPLVPAIIPGAGGGVLRGREAIKHFLEEGTQRRPNELVRWYRTGEYLTNGKTLVWEYPRETPEGEQIDILELMEISDGLKQKFIDKAIALSGRKNISLENRIDKNLIGGFVLRINDLQYNASISHKLTAIEQEFSENIY